MLYWVAVNPWEPDHRLLKVRRDALAIEVAICEIELGNGIPPVRPFSEPLSDPARHTHSWPTAISKMQGRMTAYSAYRGATSDWFTFVLSHSRNRASLRERCGLRLSERILRGIVSVSKNQDLT